MRKSNYDKYPFIQVEPENKSCIPGWQAIADELNSHSRSLPGKKKVMVIECYQGIWHDEVRASFRQLLQYDLWIDSESAFKEEQEIRRMIYPDVTDDRVFGYLTRLNMQDYVHEQKREIVHTKIGGTQEGVVIIYGAGASLMYAAFDLLVYADMPRWEIQLRMRKNEVDNLGIHNREAPFAEKYKQAYFVDWRVCDRLKKSIYDQADYILDTTGKEHPKLVTSAAIRQALTNAVSQPFRVVPFFDPGPWGGQWMKEVCDLDRDVVNFAWCFDCVPEENSLLLAFGQVKVEIPSVNLVFFRARALLGEQVFARFGEEFPIRFDLLDTMGGGNLSLQVHPLTGYIQEQFGMHYTQDESYYILDAAPGACVYLGLRNKGAKQALFESLESAYKEHNSFNAEEYVNAWPVERHDHFSIPAGTIHCSGADTMVLEISATPYLFTFKLWDWDRPGLDGKPRPINLDHGKKVLQDDRDGDWVKENVLGLVKQVASGDGWREESTGLSALEFIETRRHWFTGRVFHHTNGNLQVLNLVAGREVVVESPENSFAPFVVHYAETFIMAAAVGAYTITPHGEAEGTECATIKAYVR